MNSKNTIVLYNETHGKHCMSILNSNEIFDRELMRNLLQAIEDKLYAYNDIRSIQVHNMLNITEITELPDNLEELTIHKSTLSILTIPTTCTKLRSIDISETNLTRIPEIHFLTNLFTLKVTKSNLKFLPKVFPDSLANITLSHNSLSETTVDVSTFPTTATVLLFNNWFSNDRRTIPQNAVRNQNLIFGTQRIGPVAEPSLITNYGLERQTAHNLLQDAIVANRTIRLIGNDVWRQPPVQLDTTSTLNMFASTQTVHISSVCNSVTKSLQIIESLTAKTYRVEKETALINELIYEFYEKVDRSSSIWKQALSWFAINPNKIQNANIIANIRYWVGLPDVHTKTGITYKTLLSRIWLLIKEHPQRNDFIANVKIELNASLGVCFTGRLNRLVNALVGFIDDIRVGISIKEQLQLEIGKLVAKLSKGELSYADCKKEITALFEDPDVLEDTSITSYYKQSWLDALEDYRPEEVEDEVEHEVEAVADELSVFNPLTSSSVSSSVLVAVH